MTCQTCSYEMTEFGTIEGDGRNLLWCARCGSVTLDSMHFVSQAAKVASALAKVEGQEVARLWEWYKTGAIPS